MIEGVKGLKNPFGVANSNGPGRFSGPFEATVQSHSDSSPKK